MSLTNSFTWPHTSYLPSSLVLVGQQKPRLMILNCHHHHHHHDVHNCAAQYPNRRLLLLSGFLLLPCIGNSASSAFGGDEYDPVTPGERNASAVMSQRVSEAVELLEKGRQLQAQGDFIAALSYFSKVIENYKDFALSDYARVGRALALYEVGDREEAIAEMEDVSISLKGYPEVHAALAAALYTDKHAPLLAENQFTIATLLDPHFSDLSYVRDRKHWPPSLVSSLQQFITLS